MRKLANRLHDATGRVELDFAGPQQCGEQVARRVFRPSVRRPCEEVLQRVALKSSGNESGGRPLRGHDLGGRRQVLQGFGRQVVRVSAPSAAQGIRGAAEPAE